MVFLQFAVNWLTTSPLVPLLVLNVAGRVDQYQNFYPIPIPILWGSLLTIPICNTNTSKCLLAIPIPIPILGKSS